MDNFEEFVRDMTGRQTLIAATLSDVREKREGGVTKVQARPVEIRGARVYQFAYFSGAKVTHKNLGADEAAAHVRELMEKTFRQGQFYTTEADVQALTGKDGGISIRKRPPSKAKGTSDAGAAAAANAQPHNRAKRYLLPDGEPVDFLIRLGVMTREGKVVAARYDKFRQINRFLEMVEDVAGHLPPEDRPLRIVDFGSGKSYLTFALYHYLKQRKGRDVHIVGLDLKADVIAHCEGIARDLGYDGLSFRVGEIRGYAEFEQVDMVVSLHACDTATDDALAKAVAWGASVILSVPCCQHELFRKIGSDEMRPLLKHGILKERLAALVTDALRGQMLERAGYAVQMLEFIDLEHTPKNLLIRAVRRTADAGRVPPAVTDEYRDFRDFWHLDRPHIEEAFAKLVPGETPPQKETG